MKKEKFSNRVLALAVVSAMMSLAGLGGCGQAETSKAAQKRVGRILCSVYPVYQFTRNVTAGREGIEVELMLPPALGCPHDYLLTPQDMEKIVRADVLVINGLGLEEFLGEPLRRAGAGVTVIDASAGIEAMRTEQDAHDHHHGHEHGKISATVTEMTNPHIFASPGMAARMVQNIAAALAQADPAGAALYQANAANYAETLRRLADEFAITVQKLPARKIVTTHGVFDYLARDCGLEIAAVIEEAPGQEPAAAQMLELTGRIKNSGAAAVFTEPQYPSNVGRTLAREAGVPVAELDPVASGPADAPLNYYETVMRRNLETLKNTLSGMR